MAGQKMGSWTYLFSSLFNGYLNSWGITEYCLPMIWKRIHFYSHRAFHNSLFMGKESISMRFLEDEANSTDVYCSVDKNQ